MSNKHSFGGNTQADRQEDPHKEPVTPPEEVSRKTIRRGASSNIKNAPLYSGAHFELI